jgi:hypothetical protein
MCREETLVTRKNDAERRQPVQELNFFKYSGFFSTCDVGRR